MKHPQHILAFDKHQFGVIGEGLISMSTANFWERAERSLFIGRRHELEEDERFGQALPYVVLRRGDQMFVYRRTKMVGESRLAGNYSVGLGGHMDIGDVRYKDRDVISLPDTFAAAVSRELNEELAFLVGEEHNLRSFDEIRHMGKALTPKFVGLINDTANPVGRVHYGVLLSLDLPAGLSPMCREKELKTVGLTNLSDIVGPVADQLEPWSRIVVEASRNVPA